MKQQILSCLGSAKNRIDFWIGFLRLIKAETIAEIGVFEGEFASAILSSCGSIKKYYMIDPWCHLPDWNKPANLPDERWQRVYEKAMVRTQTFTDKRVVLRGRSREVMDKLPAEKLDFIYIDGDHTLRGITVDLLRAFPKVRPGGWIGGDDFMPSIWQHSRKYEPTMVFPYAIYFAEATGSTIYGLPFCQFLIHKTEQQNFSFHDFTGKYGDVWLSKQLSTPWQILTQPRKLLSKLKRVMRHFIDLHE